MSNLSCRWLISAYIGIVGAILMAISDVILLGVPQAGWEGDISSFSALSHVSMSRIAVGSLLGWVSSFFICFGFWYIKELLSGLQPRFTMIMFVCLSAYMVFGGAFHAGYYFAGSAIHVGDTALYFSFLHRLQVMSYISATFLVIGIAMYFYILSGSDRFPVWQKYANLIILQGVFLGIGYILPAPVGGFIKPMFVNLASLTFFIIHLSIGMKKKNPGIAPGIS